MTQRLTHLLYLHGFRSSPASAKAQTMARAVAGVVAHADDRVDASADASAQSGDPARAGDGADSKHQPLIWCCPQLPASPAQAAALIDGLTENWPTQHMAVVGSSLGGLYAAWLAQRRGCRCVLLNPAVDAARDLARHVGEQTLWHDPSQRLFFEPAFVDELRALQGPVRADPERWLAIIAQGDEVLDWREMSAHYAGATQIVLPGNDHALSDFADHVDTVLRFLGLPA